MKCDDVIASLHAYGDGEIPTFATQQISEHLQSCSGCSTEYRKLEGLRAEIQSSDVRFRAPKHLASRVSGGLKDLDKGGTIRPCMPAELAFGLPALLLGVVLGWMAVSNFGARETEDDLLTSLVASHVHSLMADHLMDIASSDSHTVKPWFHGRLDFAPPVHDYTQDGFPLMGGRLEYLVGDTAAALVYRHRQHIINVFIRPVTDQSSYAQTTVHNGYHIVHWEDGGLIFWAVSDVNLADLELFRELLMGKASVGTD